MSSTSEKAFSELDPVVRMVTDGDPTLEELNIMRRRSRSQSLKDCHVRFDSVLAPSTDEPTLVPIWKGDRNVEVQLGFLQLLHKYEVNFTLEGPFRRLAPRLEDSEKRNVKIVSITPQQDASKLDIKMDVYVANDKLLHERCTLVNEEDGTRNVTLHIHAKVLSKDKGTPLLKRGIHCTEHYQDEESEYKNTN